MEGWTTPSCAGVFRTSARPRRRRSFARGHLSVVIGVRLTDGRDVVSRSVRDRRCAGLWVITYNAKKEYLGGAAGYLEQLERELAERTARAGI